MICFYTTSWNLKIQKVIKFLHWTWQFTNLTKIQCKIWYNMSQKCHTNDFTSFCALWSLSDDASNQQLDVVQLNIAASWCFLTMDALSSDHLHSRLNFIHLQVKLLVWCFVADYRRPEIIIQLNISMSCSLWKFGNVFGFSNFTR